MRIGFFLAATEPGRLTGGPAIGPWPGGATEGGLLPPIGGPGGGVPPPMSDGTRFERTRGAGPLLSSGFERPIAEDALGGGGAVLL